MSKINYDEVPGCYLHCIKADCKMADHCLRQLAMQNLPSNLTAVTILNPQLTQTGEGCEYYRDDKPQVYGKGFKNMQNEMLTRQYQEFMHRLTGQFGRTGYFERRRGERLCSPSEVQKVKEVLEDLGLSHLEFDKYEMHYCWED